MLATSQPHGGYERRRRTSSKPRDARSPRRRKLRRASLKLPNGTNAQAGHVGELRCVAAVRRSDVWRLCGALRSSMCWHVAAQGGSSAGHMGERHTPT